MDDVEKVKNFMYYRLDNVKFGSRADFVMTSRRLHDIFDNVENARRGGEVAKLAFERLLL